MKYKKLIVLGITSFIFSFLFIIYLLRFSIFARIQERDLISQNYFTEIANSDNRYWIIYSNPSENYYEHWYFFPEHRKVLYVYYQTKESLLSIEMKNLLYRKLSDITNDDLKILKKALAHKKTLEEYNMELNNLDLYEYSTEFNNENILIIVRTTTNAPEKSTMIKLDYATELLEVLNKVK